MAYLRNHLVDDATGLSGHALAHQALGHFAGLQSVIQAETCRKWGAEEGVGGRRRGA